MIKMNFTDNQTALEYAIYMMVGSYFKKAKCTSPILEKKMKVQYAEQKADNQYRMEEICIRFAEEELVPKLPKGYLDSEVKVRFLGQGSDDRRIVFEAPNFTFTIRGDYRGRKTKLDWEMQDLMEKAPTER